MTYAPVVLFVYNRPVHTRKTLNALKENGEVEKTDLWIFADGPKRGIDRGRVTEVRDYVYSVRRENVFNSVSIVESETNMGLAQSVIDGVTRVVRQYGKAIVLEDDLVASADFLSFMNACLEFYELDSSIGSVTGYSPVEQLPADYPDDVYLAPRNCSWGWATWSDRWNAVDWECKAFAAFRRNPIDRRRFNSCGTDRFSRLRRQLTRDAGSWSIRFGFWQFMSGMNTVYSRHNRVLNIGGDDSGTHDSTGARYSGLRASLPPFKLSSPSVDRRILNALKQVYSPTLARRLSALGGRLAGVR